MKIGEYVRTDKGIIFKINSGTDIDMVEFENAIIGSITKHSKNIIDLIEDDDLIELEYYVKSKGKRIKRLFEVSILGGEKIYFDNAHCGLAYDIQSNLWLDKGFNPKITTILTHESYEENCYKVVK